MALDFSKATPLEENNISTIQDIYMTEVKDRYCNIRMLPDGFDCLSLVNPISKIDHINLQFK